MGQPYPYLNPNLPVEARVEDLLQRMTLEEKVGQMCQYVLPKDVALPVESAKADIDDASVHYTREERNAIPGLIKAGLIGSILSETDPERLNAMQQAASSSRLGIPLLFGIDAIHGNALRWGGTIYPAPIGLAATWDTTLVERIAEAVGEELRANNLHWTFSPNLDVARDGRWGRFGETFGEDVYLVSEMGKAMIRGYQGDLSDPEKHVLACAKHYIAGGEPDNGLNFCAMDLSERGLREVFLPPFAEAVKAGVATFMAAHNEINGVPCHANRYLLTELLREELGFAGFLVSDWTDVHRLYTLHRVARSIKEADYLTVDAGMDMHMHGPGFLEPVVELVREGTLPESRIDESVRRILTTKFKLGLFEHRYVDTTRAKEVQASPAYQTLALEAARKSITLLKNEGDLLPLPAAGGAIFVTGPNANNLSLMGDWAFDQPAGHVVTVLDGIREQAGAREVRFYDCGDLLAIGDDQIRAAAEQAQGAAVAVLVVGENPLRYSPTKTEGENVDRSDLDLPGRQLELIQAVAAVGVPVVVVLVNGRPLSIPWIAENVQAVLEAYHPGMEGGRAVAEVLFGKVNPSGRLPFTMPRTVGQLRAVYNHRPADYFRHYRLTPNEPQYPFGFGLSYTSFVYSDLHLPEQVSLAALNAGEHVPVEVTVTNTGSCEGDDVVLVYLHDEYSSVTTPVRNLKAFRRVLLQPGESQTLRFELQPDQLALYNVKMERVIEPGAFEVFVGNLYGKFEVVDGS